MLSDQELGELEHHIEQHIGPPENVLHELIPDDVHVDVHIVPPAKERNYVTLVTSGMSEHPMTVPKKMSEARFAELMLCLPPSWPVEDEALEDEQHGWPIFWLRMLAKAPHEHRTWFGPGHTIPNGDPAEPLGQGTQMCCNLIRSPVLPPAAFRKLQTKRGTVNFYAVVPIYLQEMERALANGPASLEALLDQNQVTELLDPRRKNVCP
jgi:hypothetical protein